ncbi:MAG TPA: hypothetical protein VLH13_02685, partial [Methanomassiliicoccales archaeon]|nr:hypothetical protein [Methanomassiliicoccales archaeon]
MGLIYLLIKWEEDPYPPQYPQYQPYQQPYQAPYQQPSPAYPPSNQQYGPGPRYCGGCGTPLDTGAAF